MRALLLRDLRLFLRSGGGFGFAVSFFLMIVVLVPLSLGPSSAILASIAPGILWLAALLSCLLSLDKLFALDFEDGSLELLSTALIPLESVVLTKAFAHWMVTGLPLTVISPVMGVLLHLPAPAYGWLILSLLVGTPALSLIGAFGAGLVVSVRRGGLLLSLLVLPTYIPTLIFGAETTGRAARGVDPLSSLLLLGGVSAGAIALIPFAAAAALRINLRQM